jgi:hypothetical protein
MPTSSATVGMGFPSLLDNNWEKIFCHHSCIASSQPTLILASGLMKGERKDGKGKRTAQLIGKT